MALDLSLNGHDLGGLFPPSDDEANRKDAAIHEERESDEACDNRITGIIFLLDMARYRSRGCSRGAAILLCRWALG